MSAPDLGLQTILGIECQSRQAWVIRPRQFPAPEILMRLVALDHVQLAMPPGGEEMARRFYAEVIGLCEIPKPHRLAGRGGVWFGAGPVQLHLGVEEDFRPARKAHPAVRVEDLSALAARCEAAGHEARFDGELPGYRRFYVADPFGNRLEFLEPVRSDEGAAPHP